MASEEPNPPDIYEKWFGFPPFASLLRSPDLPASLLICYNRYLSSSLFFWANYLCFHYFSIFFKYIIKQFSNGYKKDHLSYIMIFQFHLLLILKVRKASVFTQMWKPLGNRRACSSASPGPRSPYDHEETGVPTHGCQHLPLVLTVGLHLGVIQDVSAQSPVFELSLHILSPCNVPPVTLVPCLYIGAYHLLGKKYQIFEMSAIKNFLAVPPLLQRKVDACTE